jgi:hypothetical protein
MGLVFGMLLKATGLAAADPSLFWESFYDQRPLGAQVSVFKSRSPSSVRIKSRTREPLLGHIRLVRRLEWSILDPYPFILSGPTHRFQNEWVFSPHPIQNATLIDVGRLLREQDFIWMP